MNGKALFLPPADGALAALQVRGDFFPGVEAFGRRLRGMILQLGRFVGHGQSILEGTNSMQILPKRAYPSNIAAF
jgi:hypothetical protein